MAVLFLSKAQSILNSLGIVRDGGTITFYESGTSTKLDTYSDDALTTPNANPITLAAGRPATNIYLKSQDYKAVFANSTGTDSVTVDPIHGDPLSALSASDISFTQDGTGATVRDVETKLEEMPVTPEDFGAVGDMVDGSDGTTSPGTGTLASAAYTFVSADIGKKVVILAAGAKSANATTYGGRAESLITTVASINAGKAVLTVAATQTITGTAVWAMGTPDDTAIDQALATGRPVVFTKAAYMRVSQFKAGDSTSGWSHDIRSACGSLFTRIAFAIPNHTDDCVRICGYELPTGAQNERYFLSHTFKGFQFLCMGTGRHGISWVTAENSRYEDLESWYSYQNAFAFIPSRIQTNGWISTNTFINCRTIHAGLHAYYFAIFGTGSFIGANAFTGCTGISSWGENSGTFGLDKTVTAHKTQLGTFVYALNRSTDGNTINGNIFDGNFYGDNGRGVAEAYGTRIGLSFLWFEDGTRNLVIEGVGVGGSCNRFQHWAIEHFETDDTTATGNLTGSTVLEIGGSTVIIGIDLSGAIGATYTAALGNNLIADGVLATPTSVIDFALENWSTGTPPFESVASSDQRHYISGRVQVAGRFSSNRGNFSDALMSSSKRATNTVTYSAGAQNITIPLASFPNSAIASALGVDVLAYDVYLLFFPDTGAPPTHSQMSVYGFATALTAGPAFIVPAAWRQSAETQTYFTVGTFALGGTATAPTLVIPITTTAQWNSDYSTTPKRFEAWAVAKGGTVTGAA